MSIFKCPNCHGEGLPDNELPCWKCGSGKRATERESGWQEKHRWPPYTHGRILCKCGAVVATCRCSKGCEVVGTVESCETCKPVGSLQQQGPLSERAALTEVSSHVSQITVNDFVCAVGEMTNADALARVKHLVNAENAERLRAEVSSPATPKNRYGCKQCQRDFNHEPFTVSIGGIPARTYFFCTTICRERWNMGYTGEPPQFPNTEQVIRVAGNVRAASPATPALELRIKALPGLRESDGYEGYLISRDDVLSLLADVARLPASKVDLARVQTLIEDIYSCHRERDSHDSDWENGVDVPCDWCEGAAFVLAQLKALASLHQKDE